MLALTLALMCLSAPDAAGDSVARFGKPLKGLKPTPLSEVLLSAKDGDAQYGWKARRRRSARTRGAG